MEPKTKKVGNTRGPRPNAKMISRVLELRNGKEKLSFRQIAKRLRKTTARVHSWYKYGIGEKPMREKPTP